MTKQPLSPFDRLISYKKQLFNNDPALKIEKRLFSTAIFDKTLYHPLRDLLQEPNDYLQSAASKKIKHDRTSSLFSLYLGNYRWVVKRYNFKGWSWLIKRCFRTSRARRSWINANMLQQLSIPSVKPLAFLEKRFGCLRIKSYFIAEKLDGILLCHYFASDADAVEKTEVADRVIALLEQLAKHAIHHGDLKATNILLHQGQPRLLDLDVMRFYPDYHHKRFKRTFAKDLQRFMKNWQKLPEAESLFSQRINKLKPYTTIAFNAPTKRAHKRAQQCTERYSHQGGDSRNHD